MTYLFWAAALAYVLSLYLIRWVLLLKSREPTSSIAWILLIIALPVLGGLLFLVFGINRVERKAVGMKRATRRVLGPILPELARFESAPLNSREPLQNGLTQITGSFGVEWLSAGTYLAAHENDTATAIEFQFETVPIGSGSDIATFAVLVPNIRLDDAPVPIPGPEVLKQVVPFTGLDDGTNNISQITYWTLDSA